MSQSILKRQNQGNFEFIVPKRERHRCPTGQIGDLVSNSVKTDSYPGSCEGFDPKSCLTNEQFHVGAEKPWHFCTHYSLSNAPQLPHLPGWQASVRFWWSWLLGTLQWRSDGDMSTESKTRALFVSSVLIQNGLLVGDPIFYPTSLALTAIFGWKGLENGIWP